MNDFAICSLVIVDIDFNLILEHSEYTPRGNSGLRLVQFLLSIEGRLRNLFDRNIEMIDPGPISELLKRFKHCHYCNEEFTAEDKGQIVRDHMHCEHFNKQIKNWLSNF